MHWLTRRRAVVENVRRGSRALVLGCAVAASASGCFHRRPSQIVPRRSLARDSLLLADLHRVDTMDARGIDATRAAYFSPDIIYLRAGAPIAFGRDNVSTLLASSPSAPMPVAWQALGGGLSFDGLTAYTFGVAVYSSDQSRAPGIGRYIAFWNRRKGEAWRIVAYTEVGAASPIASMTKAMAGPATPPALSDRARRAAASIAAADSDFADASVISGPGSAFADAIASDGVVFGGSELIVGPKAAKDYFDAQRLSLTWHPLYAFAAASGDLGFTIGESVATSRGQSGAAVQHFGKYLTVWRKEPNGDWKFVVDGGNSRPSPVGESP